MKDMRKGSKDTKGSTREGSFVQSQYKWLESHFIVGKDKELFILLWVTGKHSGHQETEAGLNHDSYSAFLASHSLCAESLWSTFLAIKKSKYRKHHLIHFQNLVWLSSAGFACFQHPNSRRIPLSALALCDYTIPHCTTDRIHARLLVFRWISHTWHARYIAVSQLLACGKKWTCVRV